MVQVFTTLLFIVFATFSSAHGKGLLGVNVEVGPQWGASKTLPSAYKIKCVPSGLADKALEILSLELVKQGQVSPIVQLNAVKYQPDNMIIDMNTKYQASGKTNLKDSYLEVTVLNPTNQDGGNYNCIVNYMNTEGNLDTLVGNGHLDVNIYIFTNSLKSAETRLTILEEKLKTQVAKDALADRKIIDIGTIVQDLKGKSNSVAAFAASCNDNTFKPVLGNTMIFDNIMVNIGGGYNNRNGIFTAPITGLYSFTLIVTSKIAVNGKTMHFNLKVNKLRTLANLIGGDITFDSGSSVSSVTKLNAGDMVTVEIGRAPKGVRFTRGEWTQFSGYLVHAM